MERENKISPLSAKLQGAILKQIPGFVLDSENMFVSNMFTARGKSVDNTDFDKLKGDDNRNERERITAEIMTFDESRISFRVLIAHTPVVYSENKNQILPSGTYLETNITLENYSEKLKESLSGMLAGKLSNSEIKKGDFQLKASFMTESHLLVFSVIPSDISS